MISIDQVKVWLAQGGEFEAALILGDCSLEWSSVDILFDMQSDAEYEVYDVRIKAPRRILEKARQSDTTFVDQIESALQEVAASIPCIIRQIRWVAGHSDPIKGPADDEIANSLARMGVEYVSKTWDKALARKSTDPDGAITTARALVESVCKHILDQADVEYSRGADLPHLYSLASRHLRLAPNQHTDETLRKILGNCQAVVNGLTALRNELGDAHGKGADHFLPDPVHAELAVNLSGAIATFLISIEQSPSNH